METIHKQKVLMVHNYYQIPGGEDTVVTNEKKLLEEHGHDVILYTRHNNEINKMNVFRRIVLPFTTIFNPRTYKEIKKIICEHKIEIVHVHNTLNLISPAVYYAAIKCKVPVVQTIHNFRLLCPGATFYRDGHICEDCVKKGLGCAVKHKCYRGNRIQTLICAVNTKIHRMTGVYEKINYICLTDFNKKKLLHLKMIREEQVFIKPNFVIETKHEIPQFENRKNQWVFAGRLDELKGIDFALRAWCKLGDDSPLLIVCGIGPLEYWCKEYSKLNNLNVKFTGLLSNEEVRHILEESEAVILPTKWYEGFPMIIVEAFSVGTPIICSDMGNVGALVQNGITGYKFKQNSINEFIDLIIKMRKNPRLYQNVFNEFRKKYTKKENYNTLIKIYHSIMEHKR